MVKVGGAVVGVERAVARMRRGRRVRAAEERAVVAVVQPQRLT